jgi:hypothetical protein
MDEAILDSKENPKHYAHKPTGYACLRPAAQISARAAAVERKCCVARNKFSEVLYNTSTCMHACHLFFELSATIQVSHHRPRFGV